MQFGHLSGDGDLAVRGQFSKISQCRGDALGAFIENQCRGERQHRFKFFAALSFCRGQKAAKEKPVCRQSRHGKAGEQCRWAGDRCHSNAVLTAAAHQPEAGVGDQRCPGITDKGHGLAISHGGDQPCGCRRRRMVVIGHQLAMCDAQS